MLSLPDKKIYVYLYTSIYARMKLSYENTAEKKRFDYIDAAKGFCILLVVFAHVDPDTIDYRIGIFFDSCRMPLYFFLSGLFFKPYSGLAEFAVKKIDRLVIPLLFFFLFAYLYDALSYGIYSLCGWDTSAYAGKSWRIWEIVRWGTSWHNSPLWFLTSLFEVNLLYYILQKFLGKGWLDAVVWILAGVGYRLSTKGIVPPYFIGTTLVSLPFFRIGHWFRMGNMLDYSPRDKYVWGCLPLLAVAVWFLARPMRLHELILPPSFLPFYFCGIGGTVIIIFLCKAAKRLPILSFFGRYSIIVFGTHWSIYRTWGDIVYTILPESLTAYFIVFAFTMATEVPAILLLRRYAPYFTAQKELIPSARFKKPAA